MITLRANAKINLTLGVTGRLPDGYHALDTVMHSVSLADRLTLKKDSKIKFSCDNSALETEENLCVRAARLFFSTIGISGGAEITLEKHIPVSAGLGGGSADAAAVLCGLNRLYDAGLTADELCTIGFRLGADIPFCITGGAARVRGAGEKIQPVTPLSGCFFVLAAVGEKPSTAEMYRRLDNCDEFPLPDNDRVIEAIAQSDIATVAALAENSFSPLWDIRKIKAAVYPAEPLCVSLSGSGPSVFSIFRSNDSAEVAFRLLESAGYSPKIALPAASGIIFE